MSDNLQIVAENSWRPLGQRENLKIIGHSPRQFTNQHFEL